MNASFADPPDKITKEFFPFFSARSSRNMHNEKSCHDDNLIEISIFFFFIPFPLDMFHKSLTFKTNFFS